MSIYLGFDPEFQPLDKKGKPVLAHQAGFLQKNSAGGDYVFRDGANIELNNPAGGVHCRENLEAQFQLALSKAKVLLPPGFVLGSFAAYEVEERDIVSAPDDVREFGCKPSKDAYTGDTKICPLDGANHFWRYAGGHMHFSTSYNSRPDLFKEAGLEPPSNVRQIWNALGDPDGQRLFVKICDLLVGVPITFLYGDKGQFLRRKWYGQAGEYRPQLYGLQDEVEYFDAKGKEIHLGKWVNGTRCQCDSCRQYSIDMMNLRPTGVVRKPTGKRIPTYIGVEYRVPPPQLFNHQAVVSLFFGVARHIVRNFDFYSKQWDSNIEPHVRKAINTGEGVENLLQTVPYWYSPEILKFLKERPEIHVFDTVRQTGGRGWQFFTESVWRIALPPVGRTKLVQ